MSKRIPQSGNPQPSGSTTFTSVYTEVLPAGGETLILEKVTFGQGAFELHWISTTKTCKEDDRSQSTEKNTQEGTTNLWSRLSCL